MEDASWNMRKKILSILIIAESSEAGTVLSSYQVFSSYAFVNNWVVKE